MALEDDAASDGTQYARQDAGWVAVAGGGASDVDDLTTDTGTSGQMVRVASGGGLEYRTTAQVLTDIGAAAAADLANYLPLAGGTLTGALNIHGGADEVQQVIKANGTQTADLWQVQNSSGSAIATVGSDGQINLGATQPASRSAYVNVRATLESTSQYYIYGERYNGAEWFYVDTKANMRLWGSLLISERTTSIGDRGLVVEKGGSGSAVTAADFILLQPSTMTGTHKGAAFLSDVRPGTNDFSGIAYGAYFLVRPTLSTGSTSTGEFVGSGFFYDAQIHYGTLAELNLAKWEGLRLQRSTGAITTARMAYFEGDSADTHSGTITNFVGLEMGDITNGTNNWAIKTGQGLVQFGDIVNFAGTMGNSTKDPTADAPADWVEVEIGGTTYYLPAYAA